MTCEDQKIEKSIQKKEEERDFEEGDVNSAHSKDYKAVGERDTRERTAGERRSTEKGMSDENLGIEYVLC